MRNRNYHVWGTSQPAAVEAFRRRYNRVSVTRHRKLAIVAAIGWNSAGSPVYAIWGGKAVKPSAHYMAHDIERARAQARKHWDVEERHLLRKAEEAKAKKEARAKLKASDFWTVGDVARTCWGYDQTNVDFFQIVKVKPRSVIVRQIRENNSDRGGPCGGKTAPRRFDFIGPEIPCPIAIDGSFKAGPCYDKPKPIFRHHCSKWTGSAVYTSSTH